MGGRNVSGSFALGAPCPPNPHPLAPLHGVERGNTAFREARLAGSGPPSPRSGEGPRVRLRRADGTEGKDECTSTILRAPADPPPGPAGCRRHLHWMEMAPPMTELPEHGAEGFHSVVELSGLQRPGDLV